MYIAIKKKKKKKSKTAPSDTPNENVTQQKGHPLMLFENNDTLQKWHMANTPPKVDKYDTHKKWCLTKMIHLVKKCPEVYIPRAEQSDF